MQELLLKYFLHQEVNYFLGLFGIDPQFFVGDPIYSRWVLVGLSLGHRWVIAGLSFSLMYGEMPAIRLSFSFQPYPALIRSCTKQLRWNYKYRAVISTYAYRVNLRFRYLAKTEKKEGRNAC